MVVWGLFSVNFITRSSIHIFHMRIKGFFRLNLRLGGFLEAQTSINGLCRSVYFGIMFLRVYMVCIRTEITLGKTSESLHSKLDLN